MKKDDEQLALYQDPKSDGRYFKCASRPALAVLQGRLVSGEAEVPKNTAREPRLILELQIELDNSRRN